MSPASAVMAETFTPTEARILAVLADGHPHARRELARCLWDERGRLSNVARHVSNIRAKLPPGEWIDCVIGNHEVSYRHFRLLVPASF